MTYLKPLSALLCAALLSGCANIGSVNGYPVGETSYDSQRRGGTGYCNRNPTVCIVGGIVAVLAVGAFVLDDAIPSVPSVF